MTPDENCVITPTLSSAPTKILKGKIIPMHSDFHFNYKFDLRFWEIQCDTLIFEKMYAQIPSPPENPKMLSMFLSLFC